MFNDKTFYRKQRNIYPSMYYLCISIVIIQLQYGKRNNTLMCGLRHTELQVQ